MDLIADYLAETWRGLAPVVSSQNEGAGSHGRLWWPYLLASLPIALAALWAGPARGRLRRALALIAPRAIWKRRSARVDVKLFAINRAIDLTGILASAGAVAAIATLVARLLGVDPADGGAIGPLGMVAVTLALALPLDLATYVAHRLRHEIPALWTFHRVHHSAHALTPFTVARTHPVEELVRIPVRMLIVGPAAGVALWAFGGLDYWVVFGGNAVYGLANMSFANLRHSHVWIRFPAPLCYILSDPAQHQIHHSRREPHWDKNYGEIFALWDWMFGTLYLPARNERVSFGLAGRRGARRPDPHPTALAALVEPFGYFRPAPSTRPAAPAPAEPPAAAPAGQAP